MNHINEQPFLLEFKLALNTYHCFEQLARIVKKITELVPFYLPEKDHPSYLLGGGESPNLQVTVE